MMGYFLGGEGNPIVINQEKGTINTAVPGTYDCRVLSGGSYSCYEVYCSMHCLTGTKMHERAFGHYLITYSCWSRRRGLRSRTIVGALPYDNYQLKSRDPILLKSRHILDPIYLPIKKSVDMLSILH